MAGVMSDPESWQIKAIGGRFAWLDDHADGWQFGETGFLKAICDRIGVDQAVEIGAGDGDTLPLTLKFLHDQGVPTLLFEKDKESRNRLRLHFPLAEVRGEWLLDKPAVSSVSTSACVVIDVDSVDYHIAESIACKYLDGSPKVICIEHYDHCGPNARDAYGVPPPWLLGQQLAEGGFIIQAGSAEIEDMMRRYCYVLAGVSRINSVYVRSDLIGALEGC